MNPKKELIRNLKEESDSIREESLNVTKFVENGEFKRALKCVDAIHQRAYDMEGWFIDYYEQKKEEEKNNG